MPRALPLLLCVALFGACDGAAAATAIPWRTKNLQYAADHKELKEILRELAASQNVMTWISPQVEGTVSGQFNESPQRFLDRLSSSFGFVWYYDGSVLRISGANEVKSATIGINNVDVEHLRRALQRLGVEDSRFPIRYDAEARTVLVSGPPRFVELVGDIASRMDRGVENLPRTEVRVFPLRYGWASDHPLRIDGQTVTLPGVASILRSMYQPGTGGAPRGQVAPQANVVKLSNLSNPAPSAGGGRQDGSGYGDGQGLKPPLPRGMGGNGEGGGGFFQGLAGGQGQAAGQGQSQGQGQAQWQGQGPGGGQGPGQSLAQGGGQADAAARADDEPVIQPDPRGNAILIRDLPERMAAHERLIASLDTRPKVLEIGASIIDITESGLEQLGVDWRLHTGHLDFETGNGQLAQASRSGSLNPAGFANPNSTDSTNGPATPAGAALTAVLGGAGRYLLARVSALEQTDQAHITASPKVATLDNVEAVMDNKQTFYVPVTGYQSGDLYSISAGVSLRVLPMLVSDADGDQIRLNVHIEDGQLTSQNVGQLPVVSNSTIDTQAMIRVGESLLIAGYVVEQDSKQDSGVPLLSSLPVVGNLFKYKQREKKKVQRLFLVTPRVITPM